MIFWILLVVQSTTASLHQSLVDLSPRNLIENIFKNINLNSTLDQGINLIVRLKISSEEHSALMDYLSSDDHLLMLELLKRLENKNCQEKEPCKIRDDVLNLYISQESQRLLDILPIISTMIDVNDVYCPDSLDDSSIRRKLLQIGFYVNLLLVPVCLLIVLNNINRFSIRSFFFALLFSASFVFCFIQQYEEKLASRMASALSFSHSNPCSRETWQSTISGMFNGILSGSGKTECLQYIESQTTSVLFFVNPAEVFVKVTSLFVIGWLRPLGFHLNEFTRNILEGAPWIVTVYVWLLVPVVFLLFASSGIQQVFYSIRSYWRDPDDTQVDEGLIPKKARRSRRLQSLQ